LIRCGGSCQGQAWSGTGAPKSFAHPAALIQFPTHEPKPGAQGARFVPFVSHLIQVELTEELHHLPGFGLLARYLVDQRKALHAIAQRPDIGGVSEIG